VGALPSVLLKRGSPCGAVLCHRREDTYPYLTPSRRLPGDESEQSSGSGSALAVAPLLFYVAGSNRSTYNRGL
jgi:hypothetical protein